MVFVSLLGFAAISGFKLHSRLPQKVTEADEEVKEEVLVEVHA